MSVAAAHNIETKNAYELVMDAIVVQKLAPGQKVSELTFCDIFEISRSVSRNLIEKLIAQQFLISPSPRITLVTPLTLMEVKQNFMLKKLLLPEAIVRTAKNIDYKKIDDLTDELKNLLPIKDDASALKVLKINKQQNMEFIPRTDFPIMLEWANQLENTAMRIYWLYLKIEKDLPFPIDQQSSVVEILRENNPIKIKQLVVDIIEQSEKRILNAILSKEKFHTQNLLI